MLLGGCKKYFLLSLVTLEASVVLGLCVSGLRRNMRAYIHFSRQGVQTFTENSELESPTYVAFLKGLNFLQKMERLSKIWTLIQATADTLLDKMIKEGCEKPIIYGILGVPKEDLELTHCNAVGSNGSSTAAAAANANKELLDYIGNLADKRLENPGDDMISKLVVEQVILVW
ncbi:hypothetical protein I7I51_07442 [Histoplasma capsulatum]|uniref:Uncharacterized protein n=1 Tax=Ajellomyces capsulatus TaxID=5037 RepID=A0A8A1LZQ4_AJECA|nr:predicted protein [Histoplasma mississippiense (nom. inval.)]EDN02437.1 predicted protein [Histoplasma mississippiense (nom. inval.)]QSS58023.1 hypothetical protein I7I51_07442 [Histoplasma capsulatum]